MRKDNACGGDYRVCDRARVLPRQGQLMRDAICEPDLDGLLNKTDSRPSLILHIGGAKAGSTAIQDFLFSNREKFEELGVVIPDVEMRLADGRANLVWYSQNLIRDPNAKSKFSSALKDLCDDFFGKRGRRPRAVILSAENLSNPNGLEQIFTDLDFRVSIILYVRRQEDAYQSAWQQWFSKVEADLSSWLSRTDGFFCDWDTTISRWSKISPDDFVVRIFDRSELVKGDVVDDFCKVLGVDASGFRRADGPVNPSFGVHVSKLYGDMRGVFESPHDLRVETELHKYGVEAAKGRKGEWVFDENQLQLIRSRHSEGNARVKKRFFPGMKRRDLFPPVNPNEYVNISAEEMNARNIGVLGELLFKQKFAMSESIEALQKSLQEMPNSEAVAELRGLVMESKSAHRSDVRELKATIEEIQETLNEMPHSDAVAELQELVMESGSPDVRGVRELKTALEEQRCEQHEAFLLLGKLSAVVERLAKDGPAAPESIDTVAAELGEINGELRKRDAVATGDADQRNGPYNIGVDGPLFEAARDLERDANRVLEDKWWKRTRAFRRWSNSLRKRRGKPKKYYPNKFDFFEYLERQGVSQAHGAPAVQPTAPKVQEARVSVARTGVVAATEPRIAVVSMARNEANRAHEVMQHFCALFDRIVVIDHLSDDNTADILAGYDGIANSKVHLVRSDEPGYLQSEYMSAAAAALMASGDVDWIFFLDFDEFLPFQDPQSFKQALVQFAEEDVIHGHWINCATGNPDADRFSGAEAYTSENVSIFVKVALNARRLAGHKVTVCQGNHSTKINGSEEDYCGARSFGVLHFPIVSYERLEAKLKAGVQAYDALVGRDQIEGSHWRDMAQHLETLKGDPDLLGNATLRYGEPVEDILQGGPVEKRKIQIDVALAPRAEPRTGTTLPGITSDTLEEVLLGMLPSKPKANLNDAFPAIYETLPVREESVPADDMAALVEQAILAGAQELDVIVPTAWAGHEPFLFSLMHAMRPRRYVELGTHAGQSFFTACQHYKSQDNYGEAVAIDLWEGDHQAGFYGESVFDNFRFLLDKHYPHCGRFIRGLFADAVSTFETGSIDLLHIDGLHTYGAVREDYETWRSRLSENGTILFHDTSEFQTDFGVWQLFDEVRGEAAASFNFKHAHGLGVLAFGSEDKNPAIALLKHLSRRPALYERHYALLGQAMFQAARFTASTKRS